MQILKCKKCSSGYWENTKCTFCIKEPILKEKYELKIIEKNRIDFENKKKEEMAIILEAENIINMIEEMRAKLPEVTVVIKCNLCETGKIYYKRFSKTNPATNICKNCMIDLRNEALRKRKISSSLREYHKNKLSNV